jgi:spoIIIJ-associated protein
MRAKDRGISAAYYEAVAPTYDEAKREALQGIRLSEREARFKEVASGPDGVVVRAISIRTRVEEAIKDLQVFLDGMDVDGEVTGREDAGLIFINIEGKSMGILIGKGGTTLEATEYLLNIINNRRFTPQRHIILDAGGYRRVKIDYIENLLGKATQNVANRGKPYPLPAMTPKDRKLTHLLLKKYPGYISRSVGEGPERRIEIMEAPQDEEDESTMRHGGESHENDEGSLLD